uniref:hypothetical protein n=1 Tax=Algoriphagus sp. TaxID=1872435 RepID=UPI00404802C1
MEIQKVFLDFAFPITKEKSPSEPIIPSLPSEPISERQTGGRLNGFLGSILACFSSSSTLETNLCSCVNNNSPKVFKSVPGLIFTLGMIARPPFRLLIEFQGLKEIYTSETLNI